MQPPETTLLLPRLRAHFNLSQPELGDCLGLSRTMVSQVERGIRPLPLPAALPQAALTLAYHNTPAEPAPEAPDTAALRRHQRGCQLRADALAHELDQLPARAIWARRRQAARPRLGWPRSKRRLTRSWPAAAARPRPGCAHALPGCGPKPRP